MMKLRHFSRRIVNKAHPIPSGAQLTAPKPIGLWVSDESDYGWKEWCKVNDFYVENLVNEHVVTLKPKANILWITDGIQLSDFTAEFGVPYDFGIRGYTYIHQIDWKAVAEKWNGIMITPYIWELRLESRVSWYYGWDCASGCIWNPRAIKSIELKTKKEKVGSKK